MKIRSLTSVSLLVFVELATLYVVLAYFTFTWIIKAFFLLLFAAGGLFIWLWVNKKNRKVNLSGDSEWLIIQSLLKDIEQNNTYVLCLNDIRWRGSPVVSKNNTTFIHINNPEHLLNIALNLLDYDAQKTLAIGLELSVYPTLYSDQDMRLKNWLRNILFLQNQLSGTMPVNLVVHGSANLLSFLVKADVKSLVLKLRKNREEANVNQILDTFQQVLGKYFLESHDRLAYQNYLHASYLLEYLKEIFISQSGKGWHYVNIRSVSIVSDATVLPNSGWQRFIEKTTGGLILPEIEESEINWFLNTSITRDAVYRKSAILEFCFKVFSIVALTFLVSALCSTLNNAKILTTISQHIVDFKSTVANKESQVHRENEELLKKDLNTLKKYRQDGIPSWLGLGLYRAEQYIPVIERLLVVHQTRPPVVPVETQVKSKAVVLTLNNLALFETGQYELKSNANKALIGVLQTIDKYPDTQILIEGHTDNIGNADSNLQLAEKRAIAVRNWLVVSSNLPATRFAVKGYGDTRPIATNETEEGRAKNRRVEIILIPNSIISTK